MASSPKLNGLAKPCGQSRGRSVSTVRSHVVVATDCPDVPHRQSPCLAREEAEQVLRQILDLLERECFSKSSPTGARVDALHDCLEAKPEKSRSFGMELMDRIITVDEDAGLEVNPVAPF